MHAQIQAAGSNGPTIPVPSPAHAHRGVHAAVNNAPVRAGSNHGGHGDVGVGGGDRELSLGLADPHTWLLAAHEAVSRAAGPSSLAWLHLCEEVITGACLSNVLNSGTGELAAAPEDERGVVGHCPQWGEAGLVLWVRWEVCWEPVHALYYLDKVPCKTVR